VLRLATPVQKGDTMARINPDPYVGGHLFALVNRVTGLFDNEDSVSETVKALEADGVPTDDIDLFIGEQGAKSLDLSGKDHGRVRRWLRSLEASVGDERETNKRINDALHSGATLLSVKVRSRKNGDKDRALQVLRKLHGHEIHYWGPWSFDDVPSATACAFCKLPHDRYLGENEHAIWILDAHPLTPGHSLIAPKRHVESFFDTTQEERQAMMALLDQAREHVCKSYSPSGYNIGINEGSAAGQSVPHVHVHLIPRYPGDTNDPKGGIRWVIPDRADYWSKHQS
jgi:diadenosine tetraphosphate (Ap4A) HIT family hydrolase